MSDQQTPPVAFRHPEWKRLYDAVKDTLELGKFYDYKALNELAGVNIQSSRGRTQFLRFAEEVLERHSFHFENVRKQGYRVVDAYEHAICGSNKVKRARRQVMKGANIVRHTRMESLTPEQARVTTDVMVRLSRLESVVSEQGKNIRKLAAQVEVKRLPHPMRPEDEEDNRVQ